MLVVRSIILEVNRMVKFTQKGDFSKLNAYLQKQIKRQHTSLLDRYGKMGVDALRDATPKDTGKTSESWYYDTMVTDNRITITWSNSNFNNGVPIAVILQYGHATGNGGWVEGRDYINPAMRPVFDKIAQDLWKEITEA